MASTGMVRLAGLSLLFFLSGAAGLVYEVAWTRRLELTFGSTTHSIGTVLAAYMAGLGLGAWALGKLADRPGSPTRRYAVLEAGIGVYGLLAPFALDLVDALYVATGGAGGVATKGALGLLALLPPTVLMGGTLPVLARGLVEVRGDAQRATGLLYGMNTLGAVAGAVAGGLFIVPALGMDAASRATGVVNLALAGVALALGSRLARDVTATPAAATAGSAPVVTDDRALRTVALATTFGCGALALALEVAWSRAFGLALGSTGHGFTIVLAGTLLGIGAGSLVAARRSTDPHRPLLGLALALLLLAAACYGFLLAYEPLLRAVFDLVQARTSSYPGFLFRCFVTCAGLLLPATLALGVAFPLAVELGSPRVDASGRALGRLYLANTCGAVLGSLAGGFALIPLLGAEGVIRAGMALAAAGGLALVVLAHRRGAWVPPRSTAFGALGGVLVLAAAVAPRWDPVLLDCAPTRPRSRPRAGLEPGEVEEQLHRSGTQLLYAREGVNCYVTVRGSGIDRAMLLAGKPDASTLGDMPTQLMVAVAPFLSRPDAKRALVVGLGSGVSARCVSDFPSIERVDIVEIEEAVVDAARTWFRTVNDGVLERDEVRVLLEDARTVLLTAPAGEYDLIVGVPTNPWVSGVANLFTVEHYGNARRALRQGGVYVQWLQLYMTDPWMVDATVRTFLEVFPHAEAWVGASSDIMLVGSDAPLVHDLAAARAAVLGNPGLARDLWPLLAARTPEDLYARYLLDGAELRALFGGGEVLHDRLPRLEGHAARAAFDATDPAEQVRTLWERVLERPTRWPSLVGSPPAGVDLRLATARHLARDRSTHALARRVLGELGAVEAATLRAGLAADRTEALRELQAARVDHGADPHVQLALAWAQRTDRAALPALVDGLALPEPSPRLHLLRVMALEPVDRATADRLVDEVERGLAACLPRVEDVRDRGLLLTELPRAARATPRAVELLERLHREDATDADVAITLARAALDAGDPARCLEVVDRLAETHGAGYSYGALWLRVSALFAARDPAVADELEALDALHPLKAEQDPHLRMIRELLR